MSKGSLITLAVLVVLVLGGLLGYKAYQENKTRAEAREAAVGLLHGGKLFEANKDYVLKLIDGAHAEAFKATYRQGGLFAMSEFDEQLYLEALWSRVEAAAKADKREDILLVLPGIAIKE